MKWEYQIIELGPDVGKDEAARRLCFVGKQGWEVIGVGSRLSQAGGAEMSDQWELQRSIFGTTEVRHLIAALQRARPDAVVCFDFCGLVPTAVHSYRGYYDHLAITWAERYSPEKLWPTVADVLGSLRNAIGCKFEGYKGGSYVMDEATPIWVDKIGDASSTAIVAIEITLNVVTLITAKAD